MNTKRLLHTLALLLMIGLATSCREKIELKLDSTYTRLVVEGSITDQAMAHTVLLTLSSEYFSGDQPPRVSGAMVEITDGAQVFPLTETAPGVYQTDPSVKGVPGKVYTLTIRGIDINEDGTDETYTAADLLKPVMVLDSIVIEQQKPLTAPPVYKVSGWGQEPPTVDDCYQWHYFLNGTLQSDTLDESVFVDDTFVNGSYIPGITMFMDIVANPGDTIRVETRSITRQYYTFLVTLMLETVWNQGGGAGPPANIIGNMSNGALGFFHASAVSQNQGIVK